jgi:hypothetical protein
VLSQCALCRRSCVHPSCSQRCRPRARRAPFETRPNSAPDKVGPQARCLVPSNHPQHDNFVPTMTADETVGFYAAVILPPSTSAQDRADRCRGVLQLMGLTAQRHTLVGGGGPEAAAGAAAAGRDGGRRTKASSEDPSSVMTTGVTSSGRIRFAMSPPSTYPRDRCC